MSNQVAFAQAPRPAYEELGIPATVSVAKAMTLIELRSMVVKTVAYIEDTDVSVLSGWPTATDGSVAVDSQLGVDVFNELTAHLISGRYPINLAKVSQVKWASIDGLVSVLTDTYAAMKVTSGKVTS